MTMYVGPPMILNDLSNPSYFSYYHTISQKIDSVFDKKKNCKKYPNDKYKRYKDCDFEFVRHQVSKEGLNPFWAIKKNKNYTTVTKLKIRCKRLRMKQLFFFFKFRHENGYAYGNLFDGTTSSFCNDPCLKTKEIFIMEILDNL